MITGLIASGVEGLSRSQQGLTSSATTIANAGQSVPSENPSSLSSSISSPENEVISSVVDLKLYELQFKASAKVVSTADETVGTLLDEFA